MTEEYGIFWGEKLYDCPIKKEPIIDGILYEKDIICISSDSGIGKSILALQLMFNLTTGQAFLDTYKVHNKYNVLYVQTEGDRAETIERIQNMKEGLSIDDNKWAHLNLDGIEINTEKGLNMLIEKIKETKMGFDIMTLDPLYTTVKGTLISDEVATGWIRNVRKVKAMFQCSMITLHHTPKDIIVGSRLTPRSPHNIFGSVFWKAFFNHTFLLETHKGIHYLKLGKRRTSKIVEKIEMKLIEPKPLMFTNEIEALPLGVIKVSKFLRDNSQKEITVKEIDETLHLSVPTIYRAIDRLEANGLVKSNGMYYQWNNK